MEGNILAMVTCYIRMITATCLLKILHLYDTVIVESLVNQWQYVSLKVWLLIIAKFDNVSDS